MQNASSVRPHLVRWRVLLGVALVAAAWSALAPAPASATTYVSGTISQNTTWTLAQSPFVVTGNVSVAAGVTLTVEPGVIVKFSGATRTMFVNGILRAVGTEAAPIVFTSIQDDATGGDTGGDGVTDGQAGQWMMIQIKAPGSELRYVEVHYGGYGSSDTGYGAVEVAGGGTATIARSTISKNQRSGLKVSGQATVEHSVIERNAVGVAVTGTVHIAKRTYVRQNNDDGVFFSYVSTFAGETSTIMDSDIRENQGDGVDIWADRTLPAGKWPHGNRNNIFFNAGKQLKLSGYHPASYIKQYNVDWSGNFWGPDVYYWTAPSPCLGTSPYSPGHLAFRSSNPPPDATGLTPPPDGPITWTKYIAGSGNNVVYCAYDRFLNLGECQFSSGYINSRYLIIMFPQPKPADEALTCASQPGVRVVQLGSDASTSCVDVNVTYIPEDDDPLSQIIPDWDAFVISIVNELGDLGDTACQYVGSKVTQVVTAVDGYVDEVENLLNPDLFDCQTTPWEPSSGSIETGPSMRFPGQRFINQRFSWDLGSLLYLKSCGGTATFELDAVFNNYDGYHYFGRKVGFASNLPRRYNDTQAFDTTTEPVYTVGTGDVQQLDPFPKEYFTLVRTTPGNASVDTGKVVSQLGVRLPADCYSAHCIFPMDSTFRIPAWDYSVPGFQSWD